MDYATQRKIEDECTKLSIAYARHVDFKEYDQFVRLFTEDGELNVTGKPVKGRVKIARSVSLRPEGLRSRHVLTNIYIKVIDEEHAEGLSYLTLYRHTGEGLEGDDQGPRIISGSSAVGHYADRFIRTEEGWRFSSRVLHFAFRIK
ncbi:MAG: nuclear transport factor 2 family protein [Deltaproteobacteria bacterium]|nr:nuclear transport factor 2 family protein [Deltaproteobacteria bacterium]